MKKDQVLNRLFIVLGIVTFLVIALYVWNFNKEFSPLAKDWAAFGSFVGGCLGPLFSLATFIVIFMQLKEMKRQSDEQLQVIRNENERLQLERFFIESKQRFDCLMEIKFPSKIIRNWYEEAFGSSSIREVNDDDLLFSLDLSMEERVILIAQNNWLSTLSNLAGLNTQFVHKLLKHEKKIHSELVPKLVNEITLLTLLGSKMIKIGAPLSFVAMVLNDAHSPCIFLWNHKLIDDDTNALMQRICMTPIHYEVEDEFDWLVHLKKGLVDARIIRSTNKIISAEIAEKEIHVLLDDKREFAFKNGVWELIQ
ncbi:MAG: hypothetical protein ACNI27_07170 [Desulfovibrio sp.]